LNAEAHPPQDKQFPDPGLWQNLLSGSRTRIAKAVELVSAAGLADDYAALLLVARRRDARRLRRRFGIAQVRTAYTERERRSALTALGLLWGALGRELAMALDPKASHFDREHAHKALVRRRDQRAVRPLIDALLSGNALEDWRCIPTLGALGDLWAADALMQYIGLNSDTVRIPDSAILDIGIEVGRSLRELSARDTLHTAQERLSSVLAHQRAAAALVIGGWADESLSPLLLPLLNDSVSLVRTAAIIGLGELRAAASLNALQDALNDDDPKVRQAVERAVQQVTMANAQRAVRTDKRRRTNLIKR
jgi:HEAT repeat protein